MVFSGEAAGPHPPKRNKDKKHKKREPKNTNLSNLATIPASSVLLEPPDVIQEPAPETAMGVLEDLGQLG